MLVDILTYRSRRRCCSRSRRRFHPAAAEPGESRLSAGRDQGGQEQEAEETEDPLHLAAAAGAGGPVHQEQVPGHGNQGGDLNVDQHSRTESQGKEIKSSNLLVPPVNARSIGRSDFLLLKQFLVAQIMSRLLRRRSPVTATQTRSPPKHSSYLLSQGLYMLCCCLASFIGGSPILYTYLAITLLPSLSLSLSPAATPGKIYNVRLSAESAISSSEMFFFFFPLLLLLLAEHFVAAAIIARD